MASAVNTLGTSAEMSMPTMPSPPDAAALQALPPPEDQDAPAIRRVPPPAAAASARSPAPQAPRGSY